MEEKEESLDSLDVTGEPVIITNNLLVYLREMSKIEQGREYCNRNQHMRQDIPWSNLLIKQEVLL